MALVLGALACAAGAVAGESSWRFRAWQALAMVLGALACAAPAGAAGVGAGVGAGVRGWR